MDRRTLLAVFLSIGIYYTWLILRGGPPVPIEEMPPPDPEPIVAVAPGPASAPVSTAPVRDLVFSQCGVESLVSTDGGALRQMVLHDFEGPYKIVPLYSYVIGLFTGGPTTWEPYGAAEPEQLLSDRARAMTVGVGDSPSVRYDVISEGTDKIVLRGRTADGVRIDQTYRAGPPSDGPCLFEVDVSWTAPPGGVDKPLWIGMYDGVSAPGGMFDYYVNTARMFAHVEDDLWYGAWTEPDEGEAHVSEPVEGPAAWISIADRYFGLIAAPDKADGTAAWSIYGTGEDALRGVQWVAADSLAPGATESVTMKVYVGPLDTELLSQVDENFIDIIDFGMFSVFAYPLLYLLQWLQGYIGNWGLAIIALTLIVKTAFFPLTQTAFRSGEAMKAIQPKLNEIREKFKDDQEELNRRTMELFRENKVNPVGGCLPMLVQMPIFLSLFYVLMYSADLYHTEFLYLKDLSSPDPYCALPVVVVALMLIQQQFTPTGNMDPAQARMIKFMPLMFGIFWFMFPSGLVVYYFVNTVLSVLQQWWIRRTFTTAPPIQPAAAP